MALPPDAFPGVSYVMPVLNEVNYLADAVGSILEQRYEGPVEVILALGPSTDGTAEVVARLVAQDERIRVVENPGMDIPIGLNLAVAAARHPVIVRVDAHSELSEDYTRLGVAALGRTGAATVGGVMRAVGRPGVQAAVAHAYNSRFGLGGGAYHSADAKEGPAESAYLGVMDAEVLRAIGGYDETVRRGEDWELNFRLRTAGHPVWFDPALQVRYWPRSSWGALARQFWATGVWRGELVRRLGTRNSLRYFAPPALVIGLVTSVLLTPFLATGLISGWIAWVLALAYLAPAAYLVLLVVAAAGVGGSLGDRIRFAYALAVMHLSWGGGFLVGVLRGARDAVDTSRTES
ncbi:glycosyltransferase family 2 protein [Protaetiibacter intestinalis]|uniref:4,4'-diaponeurosporenoate glycosyltransferase n=1 Tax=Protaetiibacter intestinalis TaxID=2419774 RepID=A0A387BCS4_9MICO|nr:glycosyltransferase family 2 protein [Protaetiibacter intestinalis]AYF98679.1 glycosyltransferase family 2 protein [Protaetiibacter intestinalis]